MPIIFIFRALGMIPRISSPDAGAVTVPAGKDAPTGEPHPPQNFVVAETGAPQDGQTFPAGAGALVRAATAGPPQIPQNFSLPVSGLPHEAQT
jgi:hypothetical protein